MKIKIKFRAWSTINKHRMIFLENGSIKDLNDTETWKVMQFTGFHDKNGKEIYDGDVLKGGIYSQYEVKWDSMDGGWNISQNANMFEVIGNIYENPELK